MKTVPLAAYPKTLPIFVKSCKRLTYIVDVFR